MRDNNVVIDRQAESGRLRALLQRGTASAGPGLRSRARRQDRFRQAALASRDEVYLWSLEEIYAG